MIERLLNRSVDWVGACLQRFGVKRAFVAALAGLGVVAALCAVAALAGLTLGVASLFGG